VPPLKGEELAALEKQVDGWSVIEEHHITKTFKFPDFREALKFVNRVGELAEDPDALADPGWRVRRDRRRCSVVPGCPERKKVISTSNGFIEHLANDVLPEILDAVLGSRMKTPEPKPCRKYRKVDAAEFIRHVNEDKFPKCLAVARYLVRDISRLKYLWSSTWIVTFFNSNRVPLQFLQGGNLRPLMQVTSCALTCPGSCVTV
jgi:hypothetical protein